MKLLIDIPEPFEGEALVTTDQAQGFVHTDMLARYFAGMVSPSTDIGKGQFKPAVEAEFWKYVAPDVWEAAMEALFDGHSTGGIEEEPAGGKGTSSSKPAHTGPRRGSGGGYRRSSFAKLEQPPAPLEPTWARTNSPEKWSLAKLGDGTMVVSLPNHMATPKAWLAVVGPDARQPGGVARFFLKRRKELHGCTFELHDHIRANHVFEVCFGPVTDGRPANRAFFGIESFMKPHSVTVRPTMKSEVTAKSTAGLSAAMADEPPPLD